MSREIFSVDWQACQIATPSRRGTSRGRRTGSDDGSKKNARGRPFSSRTTNDESALSPNMNVELVRETLRISVRIPARAAEPVVEPAAQAADRAGALSRGHGRSWPRAWRRNANAAMPQDWDSHHPLLVDVTSQ